VRRLTRCSCGQSRKVCSFSWLNREPVTFVKDPELIRPSIPVMTQSLDQKVMARKAKSPDLSPPFIDMYTCDVCNRTFHWQCLPKTSCCNATEREAIDANDSWACPACINLNQNEKENRIHSQKREIVEVLWNPTWKPEELQNTCESFKQSLNNHEEQITVPNLSQPAPDQHLSGLQKQGSSAIQKGNAYQP